jgi:hypothetical protein
MNPEEREQIKAETKKLLDKFSKILGSVKSSEESNVERERDRRKDEQGKQCEDVFRKIIFENAPSKDKDFIMAEKKKW